TVMGPNAESISITYRLDVSVPKDPTFRSKLKMIQMMLTNGQAGLMDLNLNQAQKAMGAYAYDVPFKDYSMFMLGAKPIAGQTLEELEPLLLNQISELKHGNFDEWLVKAVVNDYKMSTMLQYESNRARADAFVDAFIWGLDWKDYLEDVNTFQKMTKADIQQFCTHYFSSNYVVVYKRKGVDSTIQKVLKPKISAVPVNRESQSEFYKKIFSIPSPALLPVFVDYKKEITKDSIKTLPLLYKKNTENGLFTLQYSWTLDRKYDPIYGLMVTYLDYLGSSSHSAEQLKEEFYKLGCSYSFHIAANELSISLSGLQENFPKALALLESSIRTMKPDTAALNQIKENTLKTRSDNKFSKDIILRSALAGYAKYEGVNPFTNIIPEAKLKTLSSEEVLSNFYALYQRPHKVIYYGPGELKTVKSVVGKLHKVKILPYSTTMQIYSYKAPTTNNVYWVNYDMVQAEVLLVSRSVDFIKELIPDLYLYNEYFGGSMGSLVFQEMRESRALAYSVKSTFDIPYMPSDPYYSNSYIGTQADKIHEALDGMIDLIENMPESDLLFANSRISILETIASQRVTKLAVLSEYEKSLRMGYSTDIRKAIYDSVSTMTFMDMREFQQTYIKGKPRTILIVGSKEKIDFNSLSQYGEVQELTLEEIFGY
ncbi:MAG: insulinase family protein, partial [Cytophagales bacterium]|nr:insulinase family protein [Cytophaga sp.]